MPNLLPRLIADLRSASRSLRRAPSFVVVSVGMLAAGLAATTLLFALVDGVLLRALPIEDEGAVIVAWKRIPDGFDHHPFLRTEIETIGRASRTLVATAGVGFENPHLWAMTDGDTAEDVRGALVTGAFFEVIGARPVIGRTLTTSDDNDGAAPVLVLSHAYWQRRFGGRNVLGSVVTLDEQRFTLVGVMPAGVAYPQDIDVWRPLATVSATAPFGRYQRRNVDLVARRAPGVSLDAARAELATLMRGLDAEAPAGMPRGLMPVVRPYRDVVVGDAGTPLVALLGMTGLVLLIACANVASLALVRAQGRRSESAIRLSLGASRIRLLTPMVVEIVLVTSLAAGAGLALAWWGLPLLLTLAPDRLPLDGTITISRRVVGVAAVLACVCAAAGAIGPAWASTRMQPAAVLRHRPGSGPARRRGLRLLVVAQAALAVLVVCSAAGLVRTVTTLNRVEVGLDEDRLSLVRLALPHSLATEPTRLQPALEAIVTSVATLPGVEAVTPVNTPPFSGSGWDVPRYIADGQAADTAEHNPPLGLQAVHPGFFETLGIELIRGRAFTAADTGSSQMVAVVSADVAARAWPGQDPLGRQVRMGGADSTEPWRTVVGVVRDVRYRDVRLATPTLYLPADQLVVSAQALTVRAAPGVVLTDASVRARVAAAVPDALVRDVVPFTTLRSAPMTRPRFQAWLVSCFAVAALLLAAAGLYAVTAAGVRQRRPEFGIRLALGATRSLVGVLVVREGVRLAAFGCLAGLVLAAVAAEHLQPLLFGVTLIDPSIIVVSAVLVLTSAIAACALPARQAAAVDPARLLRSD